MKLIITENESVLTIEGPPSEVEELVTKAVTEWFEAVFGPQEAATEPPPPPVPTSCDPNFLRDS